MPSGLVVIVSSSEATVVCSFILHFSPPLFSTFYACPYVLKVCFLINILYHLVACHMCVIVITPKAQCERGKMIGVGVRKD